MSGSDFGKIGEAYVELVGKDDLLDAALDRAKVNTESATSDMAVSVNKNVTGSFDRAGAAIENSTAGIRKLQGALGSVIGVATGLVGIFAIISTAIVGLVALAKKFGDESERTKEEWETIRQTISGVENNLRRQEIAVADITETEKTRLLITIQAREEQNKLDQLYKDGVLTNEELWALRIRLKDVTAAQLEIQVEQVEIQNKALEQHEKFLENLEAIKNKAIDIRLEMEATLEAGQKVLDMISVEMAGGLGPEVLGPFAEDFEEAGRKSGAAFAKSFSDAAGNQTGIQSLTGSMETMRQQILDEIQALKFRGSS